MADHAIRMAGSQKRWNENEQHFLQQMTEEFRSVQNEYLGTHLTDPTTLKAAEDDNWSSFPTAIANVCTTLCSIVYTDAAETGPFATFMTGDSNNQLLDFEEVTVENKETHIMARVYTSPSAGACFIVFRGTDFYHKRGVRVNLMSDVQGDWKPFNTPEGQIYVHGGFKRAFESIEQPLLDVVSQVNERYGGRITRHYICGHSLGGAMAALCAVSSSFHPYFSGGLITLGQPRVFHKDAHGAVSLLIGSRSWRMVNRGDGIVLANILPGYRFLLRARVFEDEGRSYADMIGDRQHFAGELMKGKFSMDQHARHLYMGAAENLFISRPLEIPLHEVKPGFGTSPFGHYSRVCFSSAAASTSLFSDPDEEALVRHYVADFMAADKDNSGLVFLPAFLYLYLCRTMYLTQENNRLLSREEFLAIYDTDDDGYIDSDVDFFEETDDEL